MIILGALFIVVVIALQGLMLSVAWNAVIPFVFGLPSIGITQGLSLIILVRLILPTSTSTGKK